VDREVGNRGGRAAEGTVRITLQPDFPKAHLQRVVREETADERTANIQEELNRLGGLNRADCAWEHAQDPRLASGGDEARRRRDGIQATVAGPPVGVKDRDHPLELKDRAVDIGLL